MSTMKKVPKPADRMEWKRTRHPYVGASDASCLYGANPWKSLADLCVEKMQDDPDPDLTSEAIDRGHRLEPFLLQWWGDKHGLEVITPDELFVCGRLMATLDGIPVGTEDDWIEAKTTNQRWSEVPEHVHHQVVAQAAASGKKRCFVVALDADMKFKEWEIEPTEEEVGDLLNRVEKFWNYLDLGMTPPEAEFTAEHIVKIHPTHTPESFVDLDEDGFQLIVEWEQLRQARLAAEDAEKQAKDAVARLIAEHEGARFDGHVIATFKAQRRTSFDTKGFKADHPDLASSYERPSSVRVLRAMKEVNAA